MMRSIALALTLLIPDRFPSLIVLVGFRVLPAVAGWVAASDTCRNWKPRSWRRKHQILPLISCLDIADYALASVYLKVRLS